MTIWAHPVVMASRHARLAAILALAVLLRLWVFAVQDHSAPYHDAGGDSAWYLANGFALASGIDEGYVSGYGSGESYPVVLRALPTPPLYLLFVGFWQIVLPGPVAVAAIRLVQILMGAAVCFFACRLARLIAGDERAGLAAALLLALSPAYVVESVQITTESMFIFWLLAALWVYSEYGIKPGRGGGGTALGSPWAAALAAVLLGLATLTRAVLLLFPFGLAFHLLLVMGLRRGLRWALLLLLVYSSVVAAWTIYNLARWDRLVIGGEGFAAFLFIGASERGWDGPASVDQALDSTALQDGDRQQQYTQAAAQIIAANPLGYFQRRASEVLGAALQPHGTLFYSGPSLRDLVLNWLRSDRTLSGLILLAQAEALWPKLALYIFHYGGIILGMSGLWLVRQQWRLTLPLLGYILYLYLIHFVLTALPRYLFPGQVVWWILAAVAVAHLFRRAAPQPL